MSLTVTNSVFKNCYGSTLGGIFQIKNTTANFIDNIFVNNQAQLGGTFYSVNSTLTFINTLFQNNRAQNGGALYLENLLSATFSNTTSLEQHAEINGGFLHASEVSEGSYATPATLRFKEGLKIESCHSQQEGGVFYFDNYLLQVYIEQSEIKDSYIKGVTYQTQEGEVFYIRQLGYFYLQYSVIDLNLSISSQKQIGSLLFVDEFVQDGVALLDNQFSVYQENQEDQQDILNDCTSLLGEEATARSSPMVKTKGTSIQSERNSFTNNRLSRDSSTFLLEGGSLSDNYSIFSRLSQVKSVIYCSNCNDVQIRNFNLKEFQSCSSLEGSFLQLHQLTGDVAVAGGEVECQAQVVTQYLVYFIENADIQIRVFIESINFKDFGTNFETGLVYMSLESHVYQLYISYIQVTKRSYFSTLINAAASDEVRINNIQIKIESLMRQQIYTEMTPGVITLRGFQQVVIYGFEIQCSSMEATQQEMLEATFAEYGQAFPDLYHAFFQLSGNNFGADMSFCEGFYGCGFYNVFMTYVKISNCYNFQNGVILECQDCDQIYVYLSDFKSISKSPSYNGGASGLFQFGKSVSQFIIDGSNFENILTEGNMITDLQMDQGYVSIYYSNFTQIHSTMKKGGLLGTSAPNPKFQDINIYDQEMQSSLVKDVNVLVFLCYFQNISSNNDGAIFHQRQFHIKMYDIKYSSFTNIWTKGSGAIFKQEGKSYHDQYFTEIQVYGSYSLKGGVFDLEISFAWIHFTYLTVKCFPDDSELIINPQEKRDQFPYEPGSVIKALQFFDPIRIEYSSFSNCVTFKTGAIVTTGYQMDGSFADLQLSNSVFINNSARFGGSIAMAKGDTFVDNCEFVNNSAIYGGAIWIGQPQAYTGFSQSNATNNRASQSGGVFYLTQNSATGFEGYGDFESSYYLISDSNFSNNSAGQSGGVFYSQSDQTMIVFLRIVFQSSQAEISGGCIYVTNVFAVYLYGSSFYESVATIGSLIYVIASQGGYNHIVGVVVDCQKQQVTNMLYWKNSQVNIEGSQFRNCKTIGQNSILQAENSNVYILATDIVNNYGSQGGSIQLRQTYLKFENTRCIFSTAINGACIMATESSQVEIYQSTFISNIAQKYGGVAYISSNSKLFVANSYFLTNSATEGSVFYLLQVAKDYEVKVIESIFQKNSATRGAISLIYTDISIQQSTFINNFASDQASCIISSISNTEIISTTFIYSDEEVIYLSPELDFMKSFIMALFSVVFSCEGCTFQNGKSTQGGAIYLTGQSLASITNSNFINNQASLQGGAIYASQYESLYFENLTMIGNIAGINGDDFYVTNSLKTFQIKNVSIDRTQGHQSIYVQNVNLNFDSLNINSNQAQNISSQNQGIVISDCIHIRISNSRFTNLSGMKGGAIQIVETQIHLEKMKEQNRLMPNQIENSVFSDCLAYQGGAIYIENSYDTTISNCEFNSNHAINNSQISSTGKGGAIYYQVTLSDYSISLKIDQSSRMINNYADFEGGAIYWNQEEPYVQRKSGNIRMHGIFQDQNALANIFNGNKAQIYGNNLASQPSMIKLKQQIEQSESTDLSEMEIDGQLIRITSETQIFIPQFKSGNKFPVLDLVIVDIYNQIIFSDYVTTIRLFVNSTFNQNPEALKYPPIVEGSNTFQVSGGRFTLGNVWFYSSPTFNHSIYFFADTVDLNLKSNQEKMEELGEPDLNLEFTVELRPCFQGEQFMQSGKCQTCEAGTYSFFAQTEPGDCNICPENAICLGSDDIGPEKGYWRMSNTSSQIVKCLNEDSCLGFSSPSYIKIGECNTGYQGILCADCQKGFYKLPSSKCEQCPAKSIVIVKIIAIIVGFVLIIAILVKSTILTQNSNMYTSILTYLRLMINHFSGLLLIFSLNFNWNLEVMKEFGQQISRTSSYGIMSIEFNCIFDQEKHISEKVSSVQSLRAILVALLPVFLFIFLEVIFMIFTLFRKQKLSNLSLLRSSQTAVLIFLYSSVISTLISFAHFTKIDNSERLSIDLEIQRGSHEHLFVLLYFCIPGMILYGIGLPTSGYIILKRSQQKLNSKKIKASLGILYLGFKQSHYYWQMIIMMAYFVGFLVLAATQTMGIIMQTLILLALFSIYLFTTVQRNPYTIPEFQIVENYSLAVLMATLYMGAYFEADAPETWIERNPDQSSGKISMTLEFKMFVVVLLLALNCSYFCLWIFNLYKRIQMLFFNRMKNSFINLFKANTEREEYQQNSDQKLIERIQVDSNQESFDVMIRKLIDAYNQGKLKVNNQNIQSIRSYFRKEKIYSFLKQRNIDTPESSKEGSQLYSEISSKNMIRKPSLFKVKAERDKVKIGVKNISYTKKQNQND